MKLILANNAEIEAVLFCALNTFDRALVFEVGEADVGRMQDLANLLNVPANTSVITAVTPGSENVMHEGYTYLKTISYDGNRKTLTVFMAREGDPSPSRTPPLLE